MKEFSKRQMVLTLNGKKLDKTRTAVALGEFGCADVFGGNYLAHDPESFLANLKKLGCDVSEWSYNKGVWIKGVVEQEVEDVEPTDANGIVQEPSAEVEEAQETTNESLQVDWEYVEGLTNTAPSKKELEAYARNFGVELKRNKTITNMIIDFKEALQVK